MHFSAYNSDDLRLLSAALSDALGIVRKSAGGPLTETETSDFSKRLADNLFKAFDSGERNPAGLKRAALQGVLWASSIELNGAPVFPRPIVQQIYATEKPLKPSTGNSAPALPRSK
jgi:hypothetical protein